MKQKQLINLQLNIRKPLRTIETVLYINGFSKDIFPHFLLTMRITALVRKMTDIYVIF